MSAILLFPEKSATAMRHGRCSSEESGGKPLYLGKISDELDESFAAVKEAMKKVDFLITTGGVSVGDFDFLPAIYEKLGAEVLFNKVAMRPEV